MTAYRARGALCRRVAAMSSVVLLVVTGLPGQSVRAQDAPEREEVRRSQSEWFARVEQSRRHVGQMRRERRSFVAPPRTPEEIARENSRRALEDDSLRDGDIVATDRGLLVFKGKSPDSMERGDFVPLTPRR